ncbi:hypothetical protein VTJ04DRAFT_4659 [Mycothermus thermophilus]|uniref:uncharacterized protein n=1 Tax=Humicola insolens TaxID=85995 RepID=UPI00374479C6
MQEPGEQMPKAKEERERNRRRETRLGLSGSSGRRSPRPAATASKRPSSSFSRRGSTPPRKRIPTVDDSSEILQLRIQASGTESAVGSRNGSVMCSV